MLHAPEGAPDEREWVGTPHPIIRIMKEAMSFIFVCSKPAKKGSVIGHRTHIPKCAWG